MSYRCPAVQREDALLDRRRMIGPVVDQRGWPILFTYRPHAVVGLVVNV